MTNQKIKTNIPQSAFLLLSLALLVMLRAIPLLKGTIGSFGYDYGFYLYAATHFSPLSAQTWLVALWGGYSNPIFYLANIFRLPSNLVINQLYLLFSIFTGLCFYWLFGQNKKAAWLAVVLSACSVIQIESYTMFLWKTWAALPFLILAFKFYSQKKWWPLALSAIIISLTHRTTLIILFLTLTTTFTLELILKKKYRELFFFCLGTLALLAVCYFIPSIRLVISDLIYNKNTYVRTGLFLENKNLFTLLWPFILLTLPGIYFHIKRKGSLIITVFTALCLLWFIFQLPFYRRFLVYLDLSLVYYSSYFLSLIIIDSWLKKTVFAAVILFFCWQGFSYATAKQPLISRQEIAEIKNFNHPGAFILAVSADDAPWLLSFSEGVRLGAPGLLEDPHLFSEWQNFWQNQNQTEFISKYPRPLYFYQRSYRLNGAITNCLIPISENFFQYDYRCSD